MPGQSEAEHSMFWSLNMQHPALRWNFRVSLLSAKLIGLQHAEWDFVLKVILQCTVVAMCKSSCCCFVVFIISVLQFDRLLQTGENDPSCCYVEPRTKLIKLRYKKEGR